MKRIALYLLAGGLLAAGCKGEFMYMKGGKCLDARDKKAG